MENQIIYELFRGFIYEIRCNYTNQVYYGSTKTSLKQRMYQHKQLTSTAKDIIERGNYTAKVLEEVIYKDKSELLMKERYFIQNNECINKCIPIINKDERKAHTAELSRKWYLAHQDSQKQKASIWQAIHKKEHCASVLKYQKKNREKLAIYQREWRQKQFDIAVLAIKNNSINL